MGRDKSGQKKRSEAGCGENRGGHLKAYGTSPHVLHASIPAIASMTHASSLSPNDFTRSFIVNLL